MRRPLTVAAALAASLLLAGGPASAAGSSPFVDPTDGAFDVDRFLASRYGFVPLVVPGHRAGGRPGPGRRAGLPARHAGR